MNNALPSIIQGGMGVGVSSYKLAQEVSKNGGLGVVAGTALAITLVRKIALGIDLDEIKDGLDHFPYQDMIDRFQKRYMSSNQKQHQKRFKDLKMGTLNQDEEMTELIVIANFVEAYLAKKGHQGPIGINFLEKIQLPTLPSIYGAMLADVDFIIMGAGIPVKIPQILDDLVLNKEVSLPLKVLDDPTGDTVLMTFSPSEFVKDHPLAKLRRPKFLAIVSSTTLAQHLMRSSYGAPDGFIIESPIAGGHNAPPRGHYEMNEYGEPIYGTKDEVNYAFFEKSGLPFWLAGGFGSHEKLSEALSLGATGIQVGTAFALCEESGFEKSLKTRILDAIRFNKKRVYTDAKASPTGFPFKVLPLEETIGDEKSFKERKKLCDLGFLREAYRKSDGTIGYRCSAEPEDLYLAKGGKIEDTEGKKCLCNGLLASIGLGQIQADGSIELPLITLGDDIKNIFSFMKPNETILRVKDVINKILGK